MIVSQKFAHFALPLVWLCVALVTRHVGWCQEVVLRELDIEVLADTFINGDTAHRGEYTHLEIGQRYNGLESRSLISFDLDSFIAASRWGWTESFPRMNSSVLQQAYLVLTCSNIQYLDGTGVSDRYYSDTLHIGRILLPWERATVTSIGRSTTGLWNVENLGTDGTDSTPPIASTVVNLDYNSCTNGGSVYFDVKDVLLSWIDGTEPNFGLVIWAQNALTNRRLLKFASSGSPYVDTHPLLNVVIQDTITAATETCPSSQFMCLDGSCVEREVVCDFRQDCLHNTDEDVCGLSCDFETSCDWLRPPVDTFTPGWEVREGPTSTPFTGPPGGFSPSGTAMGNYTYVDSSGKQRNAVAEMRSPIYRGTGADCILSFVYHMNGTDVGMLTLSVAMGDQRYPVWQQNGSQSDEWLEESLLLGSLVSPFHLIFEATMTGGEAGDVGLDSIQLQDCSPDRISAPCSSGSYQCMNKECISRDQLCDLHGDCLFGEDEDELNCGHIPPGAQCDFETGMCGWVDIVGVDSHNWTRHSGETPSDTTGPSVDHTLGTSEGHYIYYETSKRSVGEDAHIRSPTFDPPPEATRNKSHPLYQTCKLRFAYHKFGTTPSTLRVYAIDATDPDSGSRLFSENRQDADRWMEVVATIPSSITNSYYLQFEAIRGSSWKGDVAVDDISLSPECFVNNATLVASTTAYAELSTLHVGSSDAASRSHHSNVMTDPPEEATTTMTEVSPVPLNLTFTTCGTHGPYGPTQAKCDSAYRYTNLTVNVLNAEDSIQLPGVQVWTVPETRPYSITAYGASGGAGVENPGPSRGAMVAAIFNLTKGDQIYALVGQEGESACSDPDVLFAQYCSGYIDEQGKEQLGYYGHMAGGGGGGGGATFIALRRENSPTLTPLLVAAGGGGLGFSPSPSPGVSDGRVGEPGLGVAGNHAVSSHNASGAGGGWNETNDHFPTGMSFLQGATGGRECLQAYEEFRWNTRGGFGGGGGACTTGGGGGGYTGGDAPLVKALEGDGQGGMSYIDSSGQEPVAIPGTRSGPGQVVIVGSIMCLEGAVRSPDKQSCLDTTSSPPGHLISKITITAILLLFVLLVVIVIFLAVFKYREHKVKEAENKMEASYRLSQLRNNFAVDVNPCYTVPGKDNEGTSHDLKQLCRDNLRLISALGQGAFGEVFRGVYRPPQQKKEIDVAVKTLPEHCTEQDELDFLMEALIMGNFSHPNIVSLLGVCFKEKPHFIVLEFMEGGELKQFLRDIRPTEEKPSSVTMQELLRIAQDVAEGCSYLESCRFIHRDIAARNILLTSRDGVERTAKIADFGMARDIYRADYYRKGGQALLPVKWMPPEAFQDGIFTSKTDVWAYGVLLWEIVSLGFMPYPGMSNQEVIQFVASGERMNPPRNCPQPVFNLMSQCWRHIPEDRPSFTMILESINYCLQDPDVLETPLPKVLIERKKQLTIIRPADPRTSPVLRVERPMCSANPSPSGSQQASPSHPLTSPDSSHAQAAHPSQNDLNRAGFANGAVGYQNLTPTPGPTMLFMNESYGLNKPTRDSGKSNCVRTPSQVPLSNGGSSTDRSDSETSCEMLTLLGRTVGDSPSRAGLVPATAGVGVGDGSRPRRATSMRESPSPPEEGGKRPLTRGLSWSQSQGKRRGSPPLSPPPSPDSHPTPPADIHRPASLPGIPALLTTTPSSSPSSIQIPTPTGSLGGSGRRTPLNGSLSRAGSFRQKLSQKLSRAHSNTDSEPLVRDISVDDGALNTDTKITQL